MKTEQIGVCGLYCGACKNYDEGKVSCGGCSSLKLIEWCEKCAMRLCAVRRGINACIECAEYPCQTHDGFYSDGNKWEEAKHRNDILKNLKYLKEAGYQNWLLYQKKRWSCSCGKSYTFYDSVCSGCGEYLNSYFRIDGRRYLFENKKIKSGNEDFTLRLLRCEDKVKLGKYFDLLSEETRKRFGPHPINCSYAEYLCDNIHRDYYTARFVLEHDVSGDITGYFILDFNLSPHELKRYDEAGIKLNPFKDILFAPSISDKFQNSGLASLSMPYLIDFAEENQAESIVLMGGTQETNHRAIRFYEKFGFKKVGEYSTDVYNYDMILELNSGRKNANIKQQ